MRVSRLIVLLAGMWAMSALANTPLPDGPHVVANGRGKVTVVPDMAEIQVAIDVNDGSSRRAKQRVDEAVNRFLAELDKQGVAEVDIEASNLSMQEDVDTNDDGRRVSNGFNAQRSIEFKLRDLGKFNALLDAALEAGMNRFGDARFTSSKEESLRAEARAKAAQAATARARELAAGFSARLGMIYSINSANDDLSSRYRYGRDSLDTVTVSGSRAQPGRYLEPEIEYSESVTAVFSLQP